MIGHVVGWAIRQSGRHTTGADVLGHVLLRSAECEWIASTVDPSGVFANGWKSPGFPVAFELRLRVGEMLCSPDDLRVAADCLEESGFSRFADLFRQAADAETQRQAVSH